MMFARLFAVLITPLFLTGCLLAPGAFEARMTIDHTGAFTFAYQGEAIIVPPDESGDEEAEKADEDGADSFDRSMDSAIREASRRLMGGVDTADEESLRAFAARLEDRQGWNSVEYRGDGVFMVDYSITGQLDRDFVFPVLPDFMLLLPMVIASPLDDGAIRVEIPALMKQRDDEEGPTPESRGGGQFTLVTDAAIVSENSETGATQTADGRTELRWSSAEDREGRPEAVIRLD
ncbi:MAG: hypothetical protein AAGE05_02290 [Pseudomonadota bacterium]